MCIHGRLTLCTLTVLSLTLPVLNGGYSPDIPLIVGGEDYRFKFLLKKFRKIWKNLDRSHSARTAAARIMQRGKQPYSPRCSPALGRMP
jgi:hypothetical protein